MHRPPLTLVLVASMLAVSVVAASCGGRGGGPPSGPQALGASGTPASSVVGPQGGTVSLSNGTSVSVPAGAFTGDQTVTITPSASSPDAEGETTVGPEYVLGPDGVTFSKPVVVTLAFDPALLPAGATASDVTVYTAPTGTTTFTALPTTPVDTTHVAALTTHFSRIKPKVKGGGPKPPVPVGNCMENAQHCSDTSSSAPSSGAPPSTCNPGSDGTKDILAVCSGNTLQLPCSCTDEANKPKPGAQCPSSCVLEPQCAALKDVPPTFRVFYNYAALPLPRLPLILPMTHDQAQATWVAGLLDKYYGRNHLDPAFPVDIKPGELADQEAGTAWAQMLPASTMPGATQKDVISKRPRSVMTVVPAAFQDMSPADLLSTLGHEMIHYWQATRTLPGKQIRRFPPELQAFITDVREIEAYTWETGGIAPPEGGYTKSKVVSCLSTTERQEANDLLACYKIKARSALICSLSPLDHPDADPALKEFFENDPFGKTIASEYADYPKYDVRKTPVPVVPCSCR